MGGRRFLPKMCKWQEPLANDRPSRQRRCSRCDNRARSPHVSYAQFGISRRNECSSKFICETRETFPAGKGQDFHAVSRFAGICVVVCLIPWHPDFLTYPRFRSPGYFAIRHDLSEHGRGLAAGARRNLCASAQCDKLRASGLRPIGLYHQRHDVL